MQFYKGSSLDWYIVTEVSDKLGASIFRVQEVAVSWITKSLKLEAESFSEKNKYLLTEMASHLRRPEHLSPL
jgi:hypothetical protein